MKKFILSICLVLGIIIASWTTYLQSQFLSSIGISPLGAIAIEPLLIITSFLIGYKISNWHRVVSIAFMSILTVVSMTSILSMYLKNTYFEISQMEQNKVRIEQLQKNENLIQNSLSSLTERGIGSKNTLKLIDKLQTQQEVVNIKTNETELSSIIKVLSTFLMLSPEKATLLFSILISLATVFSPPFLFYSSGLLINNIKRDEVKKESIDNTKQSDEVLPPIQIKIPEKVEEVPSTEKKLEMIVPEEKIQPEKIEKKIFVPIEHGVHGSYIPSN